MRRGSAPGAEQLAPSGLCQKKDKETHRIRRFRHVLWTGPDNASTGGLHPKSLNSKGLKRAKIRGTPGMPPALLDEREVTVPRAAIESLPFVRSYPSRGAKGALATMAEVAIKRAPMAGAARQRLQ